MAVLEIQCPGPHERTEGGLGRAVHTEGGRTFHACDRAIENDRAAIVHQRQGFLHGEQGALNVDVEKLVEMLFRNLSQWSKFSDAGVGENDIDSPLRLYGLVETVKVGQFGNVSLNASDVAADRLNGFVEFFLTTAGDEYVSPFLDEELCCSQAYPGCATGNNGHFSLQLISFGHSFSFSLPLSRPDTETRPGHG